MKISDKLEKIETTFSVNRCDNGYTFEISGYNVYEEY